MTWHKINGPRQKSSVRSGKPKVLAGLDAGEGSRAGSHFRVKATDGSFCSEKRHGSLVCKSRTQSIYGDDHNYFSVKVTVSLCPSANLIQSVFLSLKGKLPDQTVSRGRGVCWTLFTMNSCSSFIGTLFTKSGMHWTNKRFKSVVKNNC